MAQHVACGSSLLVGLPDDVLVIIGRPLSPRDICNLTVCCRSLSVLAAFDNIWLTQCEALGVVSSAELVEWRRAVVSYKSLCRFLYSVKPLIGIWVHQNPELGNVVHVMPGFASVVGRRIIPQKLGPLGMEEGPFLWAPVFEVISDDDGVPAFVLHGKDKEQNYIYPGTVKSVEKRCNVLLLEVEPRKKKNRTDLEHRKGLDYHSDEEMGRKVLRSENLRSKSQRFVDKKSVTVPFSKLTFEDRRKLLEIVTGRVRVASDPTCASLFPCLRGDEDKFWKYVAKLSERRAMLMKMHTLGGGYEMDLGETEKIFDLSSGSDLSISVDDSHIHCARRNKLGDYVKDNISRMLRRSISIMKNSSSSGENKPAQLHDFLRFGDAIGLTLHASTMKLSSYQAWPNMDDSQFALYKLPTPVPIAGQEYAGLWGGTFGWPPGKPTEDKPGKALFILVLSYHEESPGRNLLTATKILEGSKYVRYPNGSAMFIVNVNEPSSESLPCNSDAGSHRIGVKQAFTGEGISNGYGFSYPGSKPGSLFVLHDGVLVFLWKETNSVLILQRLNLDELLMKGERVPALAPIDNFSYLTRSYSNVYAGFD